MLYADPDGFAYTALGFEPGCGRPGGALPWLSNIAAFNGYASLLLMCAGVGSPVRARRRGRPGSPSPPSALLPLPRGLALLLPCARTHPHPHPEPAPPTHPLPTQGTLAEVFRGYLGDRNAAPVFNTGSNVDLDWKGAFDLVARPTKVPSHF